jgi:hypothetical protein
VNHGDVLWEDGRLLNYDRREGTWDPWDEATAPWVRFSHGDGLVVAVKVGTDDQQRLVCQGVLVETDRELTATEFRSLKLGALTRAAAMWKEGIFEGTYASPTTRARAAAAHAGPRTWTDDLLANVLRDYERELKTNPRRPITSLARKLGRHRYTVHRMLNEARRRQEGRER